MAQPDVISTRPLESLLQAQALPSGVNSFDDFQITPLDSVVAETARYDFTFILPQSSFFLLNMGGIVFSMPDGFDVSGISVDSVEDTSPVIQYTVNEVRDNNGIITVILKIVEGNIPDSVSEAPITLSLAMSGIVNANVVGNYQAVAVAFDANGSILAGPSFSNDFILYPGQPDTIVVDPVEDINMRAGDYLSLSAIVYDRFGNVIPYLSVDWGLSDGADSIGIVDSGQFRATIVGQGRLQASIDSVVGYSALITVLPGPLASFELVVAPEQLAGYVLMPESYLLLFDAFGNRKTDYDINTGPLYLVSGEGHFVPDTLATDSFFVDGKFDLTQAGIRYEGPTTITHVYATDNNGINSSPVSVSFNGYEILELLDAHRQPISTIYSGVETLIDIVVVNHGRLLPDTLPVINIGFSNGDPFASVTFTPHAESVVDTVSIILPQRQLEVGDSILTANLYAEFTLNNTSNTTLSRVERNVEILEPAHVQAVANSFSPDTVYPGRPFTMTFAVSGQQVPEPLTMADLRVSLLTKEGTIGTVAYDGEITPNSVDSGIINYLDIGGMIPAEVDLPAGWYGVYFSYVLESGGTLFVLDEGLVDSLFLLSKVEVSYVTSTLGPLSVFAGSEAAFGFNILLDGEYSVPVELTDARIWVIGNNFATATNLRFVDSLLHPGANVIETEKVFIPLQQVGNDLTFTSTFSYIIPGTGDEFVFDTDFNGFRVPVVQQPVAQIIDLQIVAPNSPKINVSQPFQARCLLANLSDAELGPLVLKFSSNGNSVFDTLITVDAIAPNDTIEVLIDIIAADTPTPAEVFKVDIASPHISFLPPVNNVALATVETPAQLAFSFNLVGGTDSLVDHNQAFTLTMELVNQGQAATSDGAYQLEVTGGADYTGGDSLNGSITVGQSLNFHFVSSSVDTTILFNFTLLTLPLDLNSGEPAQMADTSFSMSVRVELLETELQATTSLVGTNLVLPGREKEMFAITLTNLGVSLVSDVRLDELSFSFRSMENRPVSIEQILDLSSSHFLEDDIPVSVQLEGGNRLIAQFDDFVIAPRQSRTLVFEGSFTDVNFDPIVLRLESNDIKARFVEGPNAGQPVSIVTLTGDRLLISQTYVAKGASLGQSFLIKNNPFNPQVEPAEFSYELSAPSSVEFRVFTLTGEEVYTKFLAEGEPGTTTGENLITWEGRNDEGHLVINGVYIVSLRVVKTGEEVRMKVAIAR